MAGIDDCSTYLQGNSGLCYRARLGICIGGDQELSLRGGKKARLDTEEYMEGKRKVQERKYLYYTYSNNDLVLRHTDDLSRSIRTFSGIFDSRLTMGIVADETWLTTEHPDQIPDLRETFFGFPRALCQFRYVSLIVYLRCCNRNNVLMISSQTHHTELTLISQTME